MPFFSVIIPTRDRPALLAEAVNSVLAQDFSDYEIVVVDDGSSSQLAMDQLPLRYDTGGRVRIVNLDDRLRGRGPAYARNVGVWASSGKYCAFLDDDDTWIKSDHLSVARSAIDAAGMGVDLYFSNQEAIIPVSGERKMLWLYPLAAQMKQMGRPLNNGCYSVAIDDLLGAGGFSHLNTTIISRALFEQVSGIDEYLSYEEDLDFYLRSIDRAENILYCPDVVARHNVPEKNRQDNASTAINQLNRLNIRLHLLNKNMLNASHSAIGNYCLQYSASTMKHMAEYFVAEGDYPAAHRHAMRALANQFTLKWSAYCFYLLLKSCLSWGGKHGQ